MDLKKARNAVTLAVFVAFIVTSSGCLVRTYKVTRQRVDQEITGNQGFLYGTPTEAKKPTKTTRTVYVTEIEYGEHQPKAPGSSQPSESAVPPSEERPAVVSNEKSYVYETNIDQGEEAKSKKERVYIVKKGDTLEKIAAQPDIYGNKKKWYKIYKANRDHLKSPDKIYPGQMLKIPE